MRGDVFVVEQHDNLMVAWRSPEKGLLRLDFHWPGGLVGSFQLSRQEEDELALMVAGGEVPGDRSLPATMAAQGGRLYILHGERVLTARQNDHGALVLRLHAAPARDKASGGGGMVAVVLGKVEAGELADFLRAGRT